MPKRKHAVTPSASCCDRVVAKLTPYLRASRPPPRTGNHSNEIGDGAAGGIRLNAGAPPGAELCAQRDGVPTSDSCCDRVVAKLTPYLRASRPPPRTGNHSNEIGD